MHYYPTIQRTEDGFVATFKDIPEAITQGDNKRELMEQSYDALLTALEFYFEDLRKVPEPTPLNDPHAQYVFYVKLPLSVELRVIFLNEYVAQLERDPGFTLFNNKADIQSLNSLLDLQQPLDITFYERAIHALDRSFDIHVRVK